MAAVSVSKFVSSFQRDLKIIGLANSFKDYSFKAANRFIILNILRGMSVQKVDPSYIELDEKYEGRFLSPEELLEHSLRPEYNLPAEFVNQALAKGDECYAILDGKLLASYGWYSNGQTIVSDELDLIYNKDYIYMYNGYTHKNYRGQRLHAIGMTRALDHYLKAGKKGIVSYVEESNHRSLQSVYRMGYVDFGKVYIVKLFGKYFIAHTSGCNTFGFRVIQK
jgi:hypothetical protein